MSVVTRSDSALPSKLFFRIGEVANLVGVEPHVLRYWEREFRSIRPTKSAKGQRVYSRKDVTNLLRVRDLLYRDGFTIAGAKKRLQRGAEDVVASAEAPLDEAHETDRDTLAHADRETEREIAQTHDPASEGERDLHVAAEPESDPRSQDARAAVDASSRVDASAHGKLIALRAEVEAFLQELETDA